MISLRLDARHLLKWVAAPSLTTVTLLAMAGAALAAASGVGVIDNAANTIGRVVQSGGYAATGCGLLGVLHHVSSGSWGGGLSHLGITFVGGDAMMNYPTISPEVGGVAAAVIHPHAVAIATHPATHAVVHAVTRLAS